MSRTSSSPPFLLNVCSSDTHTSSSQVQSLVYPVGDANFESNCTTSTVSGGVFVGLTNTNNYFVKVSDHYYSRLVQLTFQNFDSLAPACANIGGGSQASASSNSEWIFITVANGAFGSLLSAVNSSRLLMCP